MGHRVERNAQMLKIAGCVAFAHKRVTGHMLLEEDAECVSNAIDRTTRVRR
jgi:hypothetical protein